MNAFHRFHLRMVLGLLRACVRACLRACAKGAASRSCSVMLEEVQQCQEFTRFSRLPPGLMSLHLDC